MHSKCITLLGAVFFILPVIITYVCILLSGATYRFIEFYDAVKDKDTLESNFYVDIEELLSKSKDNKLSEIKIQDKEEKDVTKGLIKIDGECRYSNTTKSEFISEIKKNSEFKAKFDKDNGYSITMPNDGDKGESVNICDRKSSYSTIKICFIAAYIVSAVFDFFLFFTTIFYLFGCCSRTNIPKIIVIFAIVSLLAYLVQITLFLYSEIMFYTLLGLNNDDVAKKYGLPKVEIHAVIIIAIVLQIIGYILFTGLMVYAAKLRGVEINNAIDFDYHAKHRRTTSRTGK